MHQFECFWCNKLKLKFDQEGGDGLKTDLSKKQRSREAEKQIWKVKQEKGQLKELLRNYVEVSA